MAIDRYRSPLTKTTMPTPSFPPEILDCIVDFLHNEPETLKECCLVAKSWIPRTRKHLFADIQFRSSHHLKLWKKTFPDFENSPAYHTRILFIGCAEADMAADADVGGWIRAFSGVTSLRLDSYPGFIYPRVSFIPFHRFSPTLKSFHTHTLVLPSSQLFTFILSSPLLEDLTVKGIETREPDDNNDHRRQRAAISSAPPPLTGTLHLEIAGGMDGIVRRLLDLPIGLHFRKLVFSWTLEEDFPRIMELLIGCSDSLECLDVMCAVSCKLILILRQSFPSPYPPVSADLESETSIDLSKATRLTSVVFRIGALTSSVGWIDTALRTIAPGHRHLREISIHVSHSSEGLDIREAIGEAAFGRWLDLDRVFVQLWESHSIYPQMRWKQYDAESCLGRLLPEAAKRRIVVLV